MKFLKKYVTFIIQYDLGLIINLYNKNDQLKDGRNNENLYHR